jgi:hypothetical protein
MRPARPAGALVSAEHAVKVRLRTSLQSRKTHSYEPSEVRRNVVAHSFVGTPAMFQERSSTRASKECTGHSNWVDDAVDSDVAYAVGKPIQMCICMRCPAPEERTYMLMM